MKKRIVYAVFALMVLGVSLNGCRSQELCPAYTDSTNTTQEQQENIG